MHDSSSTWGGINTSDIIKVFRTSFSQGKALLKKNGFFVVLIALYYSIAECAYLNIVNAGFEADTLPDGTPIPDNTFRVDPNTPSGWSYYDPDGVLSHPNYIGLLNPQNSEFFVHGAPEGNLVALTWMDTGPGSAGTVEAGIMQQLSESVSVNTRYTLTVSVGNIASGKFYNLRFVISTN